MLASYSFILVELGIKVMKILDLSFHVLILSLLKIFYYFMSHLSLLSIIPTFFFIRAYLVPLQNFHRKTILIYKSPFFWWFLSYKIFNNLQNQMQKSQKCKFFCGDYLRFLQPKVPQRHDTSLVVTSHDCVLTKKKKKTSHDCFYIKKMTCGIFVGAFMLHITALTDYLG